MGHLSVLRAMVVWAVGALMVLIGLASMVAGSVGTGLLLFIGGFALLAINKLVFKVRKTQLEIDSDEAIKRLEKRNREKSED